MEWNDQKTLMNIRQADTDDLLDRVTAYRAGMEPEAVSMIEDELRRRGVTAEQIEAHAELCKRECLFDDEGNARSCTLCRKPAVAKVLGWHKLFWLIPLIPRTLWLCKEHQQVRA